VGADLKKMQLEERKRMMNEAKQRREAKKKEEKERKKKGDEEQKQKRKMDKHKRKTWWRGRAMDDTAALKHEMDQMMQEQGEDALFLLALNEDEIKSKRENDHRKVKERMRVYKGFKQKQRGQTKDNTCPHCHSHIPHTTNNKTPLSSAGLAEEASHEATGSKIALPLLQKWD
jgi:hypothetical protein